VPPGAGPAMGPPQRQAPSGVRGGGARSEPWAPWASLSMGLLLAGGVTWGVTHRRRQRKRQTEGDDPRSGS